MRFWHTPYQSTMRRDERHKGDDDNAAPRRWWSWRC